MSAEHWESVYQSKGEAEVSWFEESPQASIELIEASGLAPAAAVDIGAGRSRLAEALLARGWRPVIALDISRAALAELSDHAETAGLVDGLICVTSDILTWQPDQQVALWHDRAVFHFLIDSADQAAYAALAAKAVRAGGIVVLATFAPDGPEQCSGLPTARHGAEGLARIFSPAFAIEEQQRLEHRTPWGAIQAFTWVTLRRQAHEG